MTTYYAPGHAALGDFLRRFPTAGANITGLALDFNGERGASDVRNAAIQFMLAAGWTRKENGKLVFSDEN